MKKPIYLLTFCSIFFNAFSQQVNTSYQDALAIKNRILLVALPADNKMFINDYNDEDSSFAEMYKVDMEGQRIALKNAVLKYWTFTDSIEVVTAKEAKVLQRKNPEKYAVLKIGENIQDRVYIHSKPEPPQVAWIKDNNQRIAYHYNRRYNIRMLGITTMVIELPKRVVEIYLPKMSPSEADFIYGINHLNYLLSYVSESSSNTSNKLIRSVEVQPLPYLGKTLVLDSQELSSSYEEIKENYPYDVRVVSYPDVALSQSNKDTNSVIVTATRIDPHRTCYYLTNAGNGKIYYKFEEVTFDYGETKGYAIAVLYPYITANHIRKFAKK